MHRNDATADDQSPRRSLISRFAAVLRGDRYMIDAYPPPHLAPAPTDEEREAP